MKKVFVTMMLVAAIAVSGTVMAQDVKKAGSEKAKTENCDKKSKSKQECKGAKKTDDSKKATTDSKKATTTPPSTPVKK